MAVWYKWYRAPATDIVEWLPFADKADAGLTRLCRLPGLVIDDPQRLNCAHDPGGSSRTNTGPGARSPPIDALPFGQLRAWHRAFVLVPIQALAAKFLVTMKDYPPSQLPGSFNLSAVEEQLKAGMGN